MALNQNHVNGRFQERRHKPPASFQRRDMIEKYVCVIPKSNSFHKGRFNIHCACYVDSRCACLYTMAGAAHWQWPHSNFLAYSDASLSIFTKAIQYPLIRHNASAMFLSTHQETFSKLLALCARNTPVIGEFPSQRTVTRSFDIFFDLHLNKQLNKQPWGWWFETPSRPLWRHCKDMALFKSRYTSDYIHPIISQGIRRSICRAHNLLFLLWFGIG